ncbi:MAG: BTAD domain-containing putative transcriptional regulator [Anaerolineae bacterium]
MINLRLNLLGSFQAELNNSLLNGFRTDKVRALLAYLAIEANRPHSRTELATMFWGELNDAAARANLRKSLFLLRQLFGDATKSVFTITRQDVQFNSVDSVGRFSVDVHQFSQLSQKIELESHQQAADLYKGQLLAGIEVAGAPNFDDWLASYREQLQQQYLSVLNQIGELSLAHGDYSSTQAVAMRQLSLEPWREVAHRQLMRAYIAAGQRAEALAQHEQFVALLEREMGIEPSAETVALVSAIQDENLQPAYLHNFASPQTRFIGRDKDIERIISHLSAPERRLVTLTGTGGMGKTRLAIEAVTRSWGHQPAYFLSLDGVETQAAVWQLLAERLGIESDSGNSIKHEVITFLRQQNTLLVFDNYEQLLPRTDCIEQLLAGAPKLQILVTSRRPLNISAEWRLPLEGLDVPTEDANDLSQYSSVQLLLMIGKKVQPGFELTADNSLHLGRICRALGGMPLALEMAGSWLSLFSVAQLADEIERNLDFLVAMRSDIPERHRSLRAIFDYALAQLGETERTLLGRLTIFKGDFSLEAARTIADAHLNNLNRLVDHALVQRRNENHFGLHPMLDDFLCEEFSADVISLKKTHARYYLQRIAPICSYNIAITVKDISYELANVQAAWDWAVTHDEADLIGSAVDGQLAYYQYRGSFAEGQRMFSMAASEMSDADLIAELRLAEASCLQNLGDAQGAIWLVEPLSRNEPDYIRYQAFSRLGELYQIKQDYLLASQMLQDALLLVEPNSEQAINAWNSLGVVYAHAGERVKSVAAHQKSLEICRELGDELMMAENQANLAQVYRDCLDFDQAIKFAEQSIVIAKRVDHQENVGRYLRVLGIIYNRSGNCQEAQLCWEQALVIAELLSHKRDIMRCCEHLAQLARCSQQHDQALAYGQRVVEISEQLGETHIFRLPHETNV